MPVDRSVSNLLSRFDTNLYFRCPMMNIKAAARFFYANVPGLAAIRFAGKDFLSPYLSKQEYYGLPLLSIAGGLIVDVGANRGQSIEAFKRLSPTSRIVAFEPEPTSASRLETRYRGDPAITIHGCALGLDTGALTFFVPRYGHWDCDGMSATDYETATEWLRDPNRMMRFDESKLSVRKLAVECRTLDSFHLAPSLVKLHAQGAELAILKGSSETIREYAPPLMCAFPTPEVDRLLSGWGYQPHTYSNGHFRRGIAEKPATFTWYLK